MGLQIADVLRQLAGGSAYDEANAMLAEIVDAVKDTRKVGELTIKLKISPNGDGSVKIHEDVKAKVPALSRGDTIFFVTEGGLLSRNDPRQPELPMRVVTTQRQEPKAVETQAEAAPKEVASG